MKSIANQYHDLKEGRLSQANFMRNLRMSMPQYVTNVTSFKDAVRILKSKSILTESGTGDAPISKMSRKDMIDFLNTTEEKAKDMSDEELRDAVIEKNEDIKENDDYDAKDAADTEAEELAKAAGDYDAAVGMLEDELGLSFGAASAIAARVYPEGGNTEAQAMINKIEKEMAGEEAVKAQYDITEAKQKVNIENIYPTELRMGIKVELQHTDDLDKAKKIALGHLTENPFYYTELKLSGIDTKKETPTKEKKAIAKKKDETELVDKANQMKPVKGVEKAKASANKASKETNKPVKGISLMSLVAKTSRGVQKMTATGEKMKVVKEGQENYYQTNVRLKPEEQKKIKSVLLDAEFEWDEDDRKQVVYSKKSEKEIQNVVDNVTGMATPSSGAKQSGVAKFLTKEDLTKLVQEVLAEMNSDQQETDDIALGMEETMDGRDNLTDVTGENK